MWNRAKQFESFEKALIEQEGVYACNGIGGREND